MRATITTRPRLTLRTAAAGLLLLALLPPLCAQTKAMKAAASPIISLPDISLPSAYVGYPLHTIIPVSGGSGHSALYLTGDTPPGLQLTSFGNSLSIDGVPTTPGSYTLHLIATDADGTGAHHDYTLDVRSVRPIPLLSAVTDSDTEAFHFTDTLHLYFAVQPAFAEAFHFHDSLSLIASVQVSPAAAPSGTYNAAYSQTFTAVDNVGSVTFTPSGTLPTGMAFSTASSTSVRLSGTPTQVGTFPFTISVKDSYNTTVASYSLLIAQATQTINPGNVPLPIYGDASFSLAATASSGLPVTYSVISGPATGTNPFVPGVTGTAYIQISQGGNANYLAAPSRTVSVTISPAQLNVTAANLSRAFDQPNPALSYSFGSFANSDTASVVSGAPAFVTGATTLSSPGTYSIQIAQGTLAAANYSFNFTNGQLTVLMAPQTIIFDPLPTLTHGSTFTLSARASSGLPVGYSVTGGTIVNGILIVGAAGPVTVTASQPGNRNYNAATSIVRSFTAQ